MCTAFVAGLSLTPGLCGQVGIEKVGIEKAEIKKAEIEKGRAGFRAEVAPFFARYCQRCHGADKETAELTLHSIDGGFGKKEELEDWERVLEALEAGEMPPEDEAQPSASARARVARWIERELEGASARERASTRVPLTRRLTNREYQNTMRDLLGFELRLGERLPEDPSKPYEFQNTAELMLLGMEQLDLYKENARRAMASAIVDPARRPKLIRKKRVFAPRDPAERGMRLDEIGVYGNRRHSSAWGFGLSSWPERGEFRIRVEAAAILPKGVPELPLRIVMGQDLQVNSSSRQMWPVGTL